MVSVCFYFQVHQPCRMRRYSMFEIGSSHDYFDAAKNEEVMRKVARKCYLPTNNLLLELIGANKGRFKVSFSITGTAMEQFRLYAPEVLDSFKELAATGCVEFLAETYYHSLSYLYSRHEFLQQVERHTELMRSTFHQTPTVFRHTELIFNNDVARTARELGFKAVLAEGADHLLGWRSPNFVYKTPGVEGLKLLLKNYKLSDDVAFRFSNKGWEEYPLGVETYSQWINAHNGNANLINLFMDYETFGEHQWEDTGIFHFLRALPAELLRHPDNDFVTVGEAADRYAPVGDLDVEHFVSWADMERDLSAWLGNSMQQAALRELFAMEDLIKQSRDARLLEDWRRLSTSDHYYYMCTKWFSDGDVHKYFNPYDSPYEAYIAFMNVLNDMVTRLRPGKGAKAASVISDAPGTAIGGVR